MKKMSHRKLTLSRETLRALTPSEITGIAGGVTDGTACTETSNPTITCETCFGATCKRTC